MTAATAYSCVRSIQTKAREQPRSSAVSKRKFSVSRDEGTRMLGASITKRRFPVMNALQLEMILFLTGSCVHTRAPPLMWFTSFCWRRTRPAKYTTSLRSSAKKISDFSSDSTHEPTMHKSQLESQILFAPLSSAKLQVGGRNTNASLPLSNP